MPTLRALECFVAVADAGSITDAAARLHLSQPAVSGQIAQLEREAGTALLERLARGARVTTAGAALLPEARRAVESAARAVDAARAAASGRGGRLRVGVVESLTVPVVAPVLRDWHRRRPEVLVEVLEVSSAERLAATREAGLVDLTVGPAGGDGARDEVIGIERGVVVLADDDPLAAGDRVAWRALAERGVVHFHADNSLGAWIDQAAAEHGIALRAVHRTRSAVTAAALAAAGLAPAIVPASAVGRGQTVRPLRPGLERRIVATASRSDALANRFRDDLVRRGLRDMR